MPSTIGYIPTRSLRMSPPSSGVCRTSPAWLRSSPRDPLVGRLDQPVVGQLQGSARRGAHQHRQQLGIDGIHGQTSLHPPVPRAGPKKTGVRRPFRLKQL